MGVTVIFLCVCGGGGRLKRGCRQNVLIVEKEYVRVEVLQVVDGGNKIGIGR